MVKLILETQELKTKAFDEICAAIERPGNIIRNLSGWAFDVYQIYKKFKGGSEMKLKPIDKRAELIEIIDKIFVKHNDLVGFEIGKPKFMGLTSIENVGNATVTELDIKIMWRELV